MTRRLQRCQVQRFTQQWVIKRIVSDGRYRCYRPAIVVLCASRARGALEAAPSESSCWTVT